MPARPFLAVHRGAPVCTETAKTVQERRMASKAKATQAKEKEEAPEKEEGAPDQPLPLLDLSDAGVKKMIKAAKKRGYVTIDQINEVMPSAEVSSDQIEDVYAMLNEMGINVVETEEADGEEGEKATDEADDDEEDTGTEVVETKAKSLATTEKKEPSERTDDPVRMYLREMGSVELLSREGEIAIAKRIEAGREAMIAGLCESPLTFQAIIIWRDELNEAKVFLRDIIDLEATYAGPDAKQMQVPVIIGPDGKPVAQAVGTPVPGAPHLQVVQTPAPPAAPPAATPFKAPGADGEEEPKDPGEAAAESDYDEDDMENSLSLAAIEAELKPKVVETFDTIADSFKKLRRLQEQDIENRLRSSSLPLSPAQERKYRKLKEEIISEVKSLRLNQARIDSLVEQLYDINKRLVSNEGRLMRLAESYGVIRDDFIKQYMGGELDPRWLNRVSKLSAKGWKNLVAKEKDRIKEIRSMVHDLAAQTGVEIGEFRKIVHMVQKGER
ncbi:MAG: RNA polymerase sigma factor region1.1 domain-containing protein, partial [Sphingobacteriales bacterium]